MRLKQRYGFPSEFYDQARPLHVHRSDYEFVAPIDWGQMEKDRQEQIDNAYRYIADGLEKSYTVDKWGLMSSAIQVSLPFILKILLFLLTSSIGVLALDYFDVIRLGIF